MKILKKFKTVIIKVENNENEVLFGNKAQADVTDVVALKSHFTGMSAIVFIN